MKNFFKTYFVPHDGNDHHPYAFRWASIRNALVLVLIFEISTMVVPLVSRYASIQSTSQLAAVLPQVLAQLTNKERESEKVAPLTTNELLTRAAQMKAEDMAKKGYFAHTSPEGLTPWYWLGQVGYEYKYAGENLAINFTESSDVTNAWMNSPTHRANIVKDKYTEVGTGVAVGMYQGRETIFVVQEYARPLHANKTQLAKTKTVPVVEKNSTNEVFNSLEYSK